MADILTFPDQMGNTATLEPGDGASVTTVTFELGDGASVTLTARDGHPLTVETAVYMLEFTKAAIIKMMDA